MHIPIKSKLPYRALIIPLRRQTIVLHRKHIRKPVCELTQEPNNRGTGLRGPDGRFIKSPRTHINHGTESDSEDTPLAFIETTDTNTPDHGKQTNNYPQNDWHIGAGTPKTGTQPPEYGITWGVTHSEWNLSQTGPLTIVPANMTDEDVDRANEDARRANTELHIRDSNGKVFQSNSEKPNRGEEEEEL